MASEDIGRAQTQRMESGASSRILFQDNALHFPNGFGRAPGMELRQGLYPSPSQNWCERSPSGNESDGDEEDRDEDDDVEDDDLDEGDGVVDGLVSLNGGSFKNNNNSSGSVQSSSDKFHSEKANLQDHHSSFGSSRDFVANDLNGVRGASSNQQHFQEPIGGGYANAITVVEPELYCSRVLNAGDGWNLGQKDLVGENGYGFGGVRKEASLLVDAGESLRTHLSDPITGVLMDDALILTCGHSFSSSGMQHIFRTKACYKCSQPILEDSLRPNLSLRSAVQAFRREEESQSARASKRKRDRLEQDKCVYDESFPMDSRGKGVQFPFHVSDRVIIKGNKRTPQRFVGRVAVVTTQCLNGWYVVKTLDNAESVKLQYRSLEKASDDSPPIMITCTNTNKPISSNWL